MANMHVFKYEKHVVIVFVLCLRCNCILFTPSALGVYATWTHMMPLVRAVGKQLNTEIILEYTLFKYCH